ncbi:hypothetical protein ACP4OV_000755 [Aristida adscensionis]
MSGGGGRTEAIMGEIARLRAEREELDARIRFFEAQLRVGAATSSSAAPPAGVSAKLHAMGLHAAGAGMDAGMIRRYSRHLLLPEFGVQGQRRLSRSSVLVVGAGGLGSPVAMYLAACGVGCLGIVDGCNVELDDLHRQTIHIEAYVGQPKVKSAAAACRSINSSIKVVEHHLKLKSKNALDVVRQYDIVVDATNNLSSRYMLSDCCVLLDKPLVSASTLGLEGQISVYNHNGSPCYRCLFPNPPASGACQSSSDNGVLGVVPGVLGSLQALETIKVATAIGETLRGKMLIFDALSSRVKTVKIRTSSANCSVCGENATFSQHVFMMFDYESFTRPPVPSAKPAAAAASQSAVPAAAAASARVSCWEYKRLLDGGRPHVLLDVRPAHHFQIASLPHALNVPLPELEERLPRLRDALAEVADATRGGRARQQQRHCPVYFICQRGGDSQAAVRTLRESGFPYACAVAGGLEAWAREVDPSFPVYW